jgi:ferredoxin-NADP reductase
LPLDPYLAGQHLPIRHPSNPKATRTYTLSKAPCGSQYRLSIKRETKGVFSRFMHDDLRVGATIQAMSPGGIFHLPQTQNRPLLLVSAGVGITPMIAMLEAAVNTTSCTNGKKPKHPIIFIHAARNGEEHAFRNHPILANPADFGVTLLVAYSKPTTQDIIDKKFHIQGRINSQAVADVTPKGNIDAYLCGPDQFMTDIRAYLIATGVGHQQIHQETFGGPKIEKASVPHKEIPVQLQSRGTTLIWKPSSATLLETIENAGVDAPFSCRTGSCGTCLVKILKGKISHPASALYKPADDEALICCAIPDEDTKNISLDL